MNFRNVEMGLQNVRHLVNDTLRRPLAILFTSLSEKKSETNTAAILSSTYKGIGVNHFIEKPSHRDLEFAMALRGYNINGREMILTRRTVPLNNMDCGIPLSTTLAPRKALG